MSKACTFCRPLNQFICNESDHCGACDSDAQGLPGLTEADYDAGHGMDPADKTAHSAIVEVTP